MTHNLFIASGIFHPEVGGPATYLYDLLPELQTRDWDIRVLTYGDAPTDGYPYDVTRVPRRPLPIRLTQYAWQSRPLAKWADLIYSHTIDLPVVWSDTPRIIKVVGDQAWERCIRLGWIPSTEDVDTFQTESYSRMVNMQKQSRCRQVQDFDAVIVPSEYLKRMVMAWGVPEDDIHVIYNALPPLPDNLPANQQEARQVLDWDDSPTILAAARLVPWKGINHIITALKQVPDVRLVVAGHGEQMPLLRDLAEPFGKRVELLGYVPREKLTVMMQAADYFVLYSGYEGLPHSVLEALRVGTPVIASDKGGNPEVVQHNVNGFLVPYINTPELSSTLRDAFRDGVRAELAANTRQGLEKFTFDHMVAETDAVLRRYARER